MRKLLLALFLGLAIANLQAQTTVYTGPKGSASYLMAEDLKTYCKAEITIQPTEKLIESFRSLQNGNLCFMQYDILQNELLNDLKKGTRNAEKAEIVLPLGTEEVHLIAHSESNIRDFADLKAGIKIGVGMQGESLRESIYVLKSLTKSDWTDVEVSGDAAIQQLLNREIDALFFIGNAPDDRLTVLGRISGASELLRLIPIRNKELAGSYLQATIRPSSYKWAEYQVDTYAARLVLVSPSNMDPKSAENVRFIKLISDLQTNIKTLQRVGHPNWRRVSFTFDGLNWNKHTSAIEVFEPKKAAPTDPNKKQDTKTDANKPK